MKDTVHGAKADMFHSLLIFSLYLILSPNCKTVQEGECSFTGCDGHTPICAVIVTTYSPGVKASFPKAESNQFTVGLKNTMDRSVSLPVQLVGDDLDSFHLLADHCGDVLPSKSECFLEMDFVPSRFGGHSVSLVLPNDQATVEPANIYGAGTDTLTVQIVGMGEVVILQWLLVYQRLGRHYQNLYARSCLWQCFCLGRRHLI